MALGIEQGLIMHPTLAHLILLGAFILGAKLFSFVSKRPVDGAFGYLITAGVVLLIGLVRIFNPDIVPSNERAYVLGSLTAALALPVGLALYLSIRHKARRRAAALSEKALPFTTAMAVVSTTAPAPGSAAAPRLKAPWYLPLLVLGWHVRDFWNGRKSLAAAFWGLGVTGTLLMFLLVMSAVSNHAALLMLLPLLFAHLVITVKAIWACAANAKHKVFGDIAKTLLILLGVVVVVRNLGLL